MILSGGDPLTLSNRKLNIWIERLASIPQLKFLRIHSRVPIVIPNRIDESLISLLKNRDPRAETLKGLQDQLREKLNLDSKLLDIAKAVEEAALSDDYFKERGLYPNIDFYSGVILTALKIPVEMFTPIFVIGRTPGWIAQWAEFKRDPKHKIARPRQLYTGK